MEKEFVPYELAVKLKALGFDEPCFGYYVDGELRGVNLGIEQLGGIEPYYQRFGFHTLSNHNIDNPNKIVVTSPTFSQSFRWFRENHRMFHEVFIDTEPTVDNPDKLEFTYLILHMVGIEHMYTDKTKGKRFDTYEEAELACLDRLIDVITNKKIFDFVTDL